MLKLMIGNSTCQLEGLDLTQHKELKDILSYLPDAGGYQVHSFRAQKRTLLGKRGDFPTGLLYLVKEYLKDKQHSRHDIRRAPVALQSNFEMSLIHTPYPEQNDAAEACKKFGRGIVTAPTGVGKSVICALIINKLKVRTLVVVPSLELKRQLTETLKSTFLSQKVGSISDKASIAVENVDALDTNVQLKDYDCVIIDEFHHSGASTYRKLNKKAWDGIYYKFGLTATPFRSQDNERLLLESVLSQVIYKIDYRTAVSKGYIVPLEAYYVEIPKTIIKGNQSSWPSMYSELVVNNEIRNDIIYDILLKLHVNNISTLCLVKEIQHGKNIIYNDIKYFAHGDNLDTPFLIQLFNNTKLKVLIGTTGVIGEGVDTRPCEYVIIAGLGKSKNAFMQQVGRAFRIYPGKVSAKIILISDKSHKWTKAHYKTQLKILQEEYGVEANRIVLD